METWKPIPGYEGWYQISDQGRVKSEDRAIQRSNGTTQHRVGKLLTQHFQGTPYPGYFGVTLCRETKRKTIAVHRLVALTFLGPRPDEYDVRHIDGNPTNNALENLSYGTRLENMQDIKRHGRNFNLNKTHCANGHPFDEINTLHAKSGQRVCRTCRRNEARARRERLKA